MCLYYFVCSEEQEVDCWLLITQGFIPNIFQGQENQLLEEATFASVDKTGGLELKPHKCIYSSAAMTAHGSQTGLRGVDCWLFITQAFIPNIFQGWENWLPEEAIFAIVDKTEGLRLKLHKCIRSSATTTVHGSQTGLRGVDYWLLIPQGFIPNIFQGQENWLPEEAVFASVNKTGHLKLKPHKCIHSSATTTAHGSQTGLRGVDCRLLITQGA